MQLQMYALIPIDMPTNTEQEILRVLEAEDFPKEIKINARSLMARVPNQIAWFIRDGVVDYDLLIRVPGKKV